MNRLIMFHVERKIKTLFQRGFFLFLLFGVLQSCVTPRQAIDVSDYILVENGKQIYGKEEGLTAFIFQNNPKKVIFAEFLGNKYNLMKFTDIEYWITLEGMKFKVFFYENDEVNKYFDTTDYVASNVVSDSAVVGSKVKFLAISVVNEYNEDCLSDSSLFKNIVINYLKDLKDEYNNL
ncbi:hypothetical protein GN157_15980 [Flavobacterium rakeshii]|uniref:Lipoprotein n=1 Tax=Flavobacterium rakeshii TaxID=1038845 RepID=A0A6N8HHQ9_9FLAO|nr:hypothetical protein [Flavobacterium rakeshii]MEE1897262.1 hypothetical protein [Flavobacterium rakeshii]MUV05213.1 hypothetical protein [Flavobacterium rakeshii]